MGREIERKFLVRHEAWHPDRSKGERYRQGYLSSHPNQTVRVRTADRRAFLTIKGAPQGIARLEFEYAIPVQDAEEILDRLCSHPLIEKIRYHETYGGHVWDVDEFLGANAGLIVAEVEVPTVDAHVELPPWVGKEVSGDPRYLNVNLTQHPFTRWGRAPIRNED